MTTMSAALTLEGLRSLELLDAAATAGPWVAVGSVGQIWRGPVESTRGIVKGLTKEACALFSIEAEHYYRLNDEAAAREAARSDRNLIAEMRTRLPALLAAARLSLELDSALAWFTEDGSAAFLEQCRANGWPGLPEPEGPRMCDRCGDEAASCVKDGEHLCDACCDHEEACKPMEVRP